MNNYVTTTIDSAIKTYLEMKFNHIDESIREYLEEITCDLANKMLDLHQLNSKQILSTREACRYLDVSENQLYKMTSQNKIRYSKPNGKCMYFKKTDLDDYMTKNTTLTHEELHELTRSRMREIEANAGKKKRARRTVK